ncbi:MAG: hypothetical protein NT004_01080 [Bacteroidetes bacterium]|nr:hypothetical protein [Bacteroidota bacterium]
MNQLLRYCLILGLIVFFSSKQTVSSQESAQSNKTGFSFRSAGVSAGWYKPAMEYWNSTYFTDHYWENKFNGAFSYSIFFELNLINNLRLKTSGTYWNEKVKSGEIPVSEVMGSEQLTTSLTFISIDVIYRLGFLAFEKFSPYIGLGGSFVLVKNKLIRSPEGLVEKELTNQGQDVTGTATAGIERKFGKHFAASIDFRYVFGNYTQEMTDGNNIVSSHPVSLSGPQIGINLYYVLK